MKNSYKEKPLVSHSSLYLASAKRKARKQTEYMEKRYKSMIDHCVAATKTYSPDADFKIDYRCCTTKPNIKLVQTDSVSAVFHAIEQNSGRTAVLNFASYKMPGGKFIEGSKAQEECLCHESFLYNVLSRFDDSYYAWNRDHLDSALYLNRALYSPAVLFERKSKDGIVSGCTCDVITCAAPNYWAAKRYQKVSVEENSKALESRIKFILDIARDNSVDTLILGAFGSGVFGQDASEVAFLFSKYLRMPEYWCFSNVIFAVIDKMNCEKMRNGIELN